MKDATGTPYEPAPPDVAQRGPLLVESPAIADVDGDDGSAMPRGAVPAWQRDIVAVSARVRTLLATLRPVVVRVLTFWDHALRSVTIGGRRLEIDPSGCYRLR